MQTWEKALHQNRHALLDLFAEWDSDGDGKISKKEFKRGVQARASTHTHKPHSNSHCHHPAHAPSSYLPMPDISTPQALVPSVPAGEVYALFEMYDSDQSGSILLQDLVKMMQYAHTLRGAQTPMTTTGQLAEALLCLHLTRAAPLARAASSIPRSPAMVAGAASHP